MSNVNEIFGTSVFNDAVMKERLPKEIEAQGTGKQMMLEDVMQGW